ncbi:tetratricopeptide repeat protein [Enterococcus ratti]|uniref:TPR domain-containing protein n=1 Tax=Enterococcus ratti TaxID=150033 RepID=A0A1L8WLB1_9ENTE|nr:tetratricopeptide repeat protein [Enterococcus ratti]OJG81808.1 TPR domain-containing protein [Enterococcus ratti]
MNTNSEKMLQALVNEDLIKAQSYLEKALKEDSTDVLASLGEKLLALGFLEEAKRIYEQLLSQYPENDEWNIPLAEIAIEDNEMDRAFEYLERISKESKEYPQALVAIADLYQVIGIPEVSEAKLKEAAALLPEESLIQFALAELYFSVDRFKEAAMIYERLLTIGVDEFSGVSIQERFGQSLSMQGEFEAAIEPLEQALKEGRTDDRLFQLAFVNLQLKENEKSINYLQELREVNPQYQSLYLYLGQALREEELIEEAQKVLEEGIHENPYQVELYHLASENAYRLHEKEKAERFLQNALEVGEKQDETLLTLSNLYLENERYEEAISIIEQMEETDNPYAEWNLAHAYNELEDFTKAAVHYEQASHELEHEPDFLKEYAFFLREEGQLAKTKELLIRYLEHEPGDLEVLSLLDDLVKR